ncbi:hypothetical protein AALP_AA2G214200 [Arabis alpina]|uniref:C3H1-type domain-containing protein n=1 Tax=Arabis alpina TaxID=50452 RepID=A0A087HJ23_ARAAL|nr:hypothetical protein AALP_AA2G214200 [Arabis alpina]
MDSSLKNPNFYYNQSQPLYTLFPPPISYQFHYNTLNQTHQNHTHRHGLPPPPPINQPPPYYLHPPPPPPPPPYQSGCVGYTEKRIDSRIVNPNYQLDYRNRIRDCSNGGLTSCLNSSSRVRDGFSSLGNARKDLGDVRVEESKRNCGQSLRVGTSFGYGNVPSHVVGNGGIGKQRWVEMHKDDYYRSEIEPYVDNGKIKGSDEMKPAQFSEKRFNAFKVKRKASRCIAGNVLLGEVTKKKDNFPPPTTVEPNFTTRVDSLDRTFDSQAQSQACENGVKSSAETVSRKETMDTTPLTSTAEVDHNLGSDAGKYTCVISSSSSSKNVVGKGSSKVQPVERTSVLLRSICKNKEGLSNGLVVDRELSSVDQSCNLVCRGLKACSSESDVSLSKDTNVGASESHFNQEVKEKAPTCNSLPVLEVENSIAIETQPCQAGSKVLPNVVHSMDKDLVDKCEVARVENFVVALTPQESQSKTLSSTSEKTQKRANKYTHAAQESCTRSQSDTKKDANLPINVAKHHTWHQKSDTAASRLVAVKPKVTVQSSSTYVRIGNSLLRKPSPGYLGEAQTLQRHSRAPSGSTSGKCALSSGMDPLSNGLPRSSSGEADDPDYFRNGLKSSDTLAQTDIHGASKSEIPHSGGYFKRSKNQLVRNSESLANQAKSLSDDALDSQTGEKMASTRSSSSALSAVMRPFDQSKFSSASTLKEPLSRKANRVHMSPQKIVAQPVQRGTYGRRSMNPASVPRNGSSFTIGQKFLMMRKRRTIYRRSTNGYTLKRSKVPKSIERNSNKPECLADVESWRSGLPEFGKDAKKSFIPRRLVMGNDESLWIRNGNRLVGDPKKRTRVLANEKVRWSLHNTRSRLVKKRNYCQFFTRFGKCNKDDGKCPYIHDPSKVAVCIKFVSRLCANPDCKLTHKVVPERMPDCSYFLQGLCNNEPCLYRHVYCNQNAAVCEGFLRGYCSDGNECRKKHTYTCPVFEATGSCPQESECKLHHPKNRSKGKKRKRESEPWQKISFFGGEGLDFILLDVYEHEASENMDSSTPESVSGDSEAHDSIDELIRPVGLMQE